MMYHMLMDTSLEKEKKYNYCYKKGKNIYDNNIKSKEMEGGWYFVELIKVHDSWFGHQDH